MPGPVALLVLSAYACEECVTQHGPLPGREWAREVLYQCYACGDAFMIEHTTNSDSEPLVALARSSLARVSDQSCSSCFIVHD